MTDRPPPRTLIGMPVFRGKPLETRDWPRPQMIVNVGDWDEPEPFPLTPYPDGGTAYTAPERTLERPIRDPQRHAVIRPPSSPAARQMATVVLQRPPAAPSRAALVWAAAVVCWIIAAGVLLSL